MKKNLKKMLALALAVVMLLAMTACGGGSGEENNAGESGEAGGTSKETLILANKEDVGTLAPYADTYATRSRVTMNIYDTLFIAEADGSFTPCLATEWEYVDDTHIRFHLREGVKFSNGNDFTADDVLFTLEYAKSDKSTIASIYATIDLENTVVEDDHTIVIALTQADSTIMGYLGTPNYTSILDRETCEADYDAMATQPVGTGAYMVESWVVGDAVNLVKNPNYWGEEAIIDNVIVRAVTEATQRGIELETGGVDVVYDLPTTDVATIGEMEEFEVIQEAGLTVHNMYFNATEGHPMANANLRKAVAYAINKEDIVIGGYDGSAQVATSFASSAAIGYQYATNDGECFPQDVEAAKNYVQAYMDETGVATPTVNILYDTNAARTATAQIVQKQLEDIGITVTLEQYDFGTSLNLALDQTYGWDIYLLGNGETSVLLQAGRFDKAQAPFQAYSSDALQALYDELRVTSDAKAQEELYTQIYDYVIENAVLVPYCEEIAFMAIPAGLQNFDIFNSNGVYFADLYFE